MVKNNIYMYYQNVFTVKYNVIIIKSKHFMKFLINKYKFRNKRLDSDIYMSNLGELYFPKSHFDRLHLAMWSIDINK